MKTKYVVVVLGLCINAARADISCDSGTCLSKFNCYESISINDGAPRGNGFICENAGDGTSTCSCTLNGSTKQYPMYCQTSVDCISGYICNGYWECVPDANTSCPPGDWQVFSDFDEGYQIRELQMMEDWGCDSSGQYELRCNAGYYGTPEWPEDEDPIGCSMCPPLGGTLANSATGATKKNQCYIPANTKLMDDSGVFEYTSNCFYSN